MKEQLISFETAKLANKKEFIECTENRYNKKGTFNYSKAYSISAPTQSLLQKWLRETHNIVVLVWYNPELQEWESHISEKYYESKFETYEEALEKGLQEALKLIK